MLLIINYVVSLLERNPLKKDEWEGDLGWYWRIAKCAGDNYGVSVGIEIYTIVQSMQIQRAYDISWDKVGLVKPNGLGVSIWYLY